MNDHMDVGETGGCEFSKPTNTLDEVVTFNILHYVKDVGVIEPFVKGYGHEEVPLGLVHPFGYVSMFFHYLI